MGERRYLQLTWILLYVQFISAERIIGSITNANSDDIITIEPIEEAKSVVSDNTNSHKILKNYGDNSLTDEEIRFIGQTYNYETDIIKEILRTRSPVIKIKKNCRRLFVFQLHPIGLQTTVVLGSKATSVFTLPLDEILQLTNSEPTENEIYHISSIFRFNNKIIPYLLSSESPWIGNTTTNDGHRRQSMYALHPDGIASYILFCTGDFPKQNNGKNCFSANSVFNVKIFKTDPNISSVPIFTTTISPDTITPNNEWEWVTGPVDRGSTRPPFPVQTPKPTEQTPSEPRNTRTTTDIQKKIIDDFLSQWHLKEGDILQNNVELRKTIVDKDGRVLTATFTLTAGETDGRRGSSDERLLKFEAL